MALIKCPECGKDVSSAADKCVYCGYPISNHIQKELHDTEIERLTRKIIQCEFSVPAPRIKVCIKCTRPFSSLIDSSFRKPQCKCGFPGVEVDYQEMYGGNGHLPTMAYILESCVIPRNIGDTESEEYQLYVKDLYAQLQRRGRSAERTPPNPKYFGLEPDQEDFRKSEQALSALHKSLQSSSSLNIPQCPICHSTNLSKLSTKVSFLKIASFGLAGAGDVGKTWKCNNCGSKF